MANLGHDLNNQLTIISSAAELMTILIKHTLLAQIGNQSVKFDWVEFGTLADEIRGAAQRCAWIAADLQHIEIVVKKIADDDGS